ncbi:MAG: pectinesterase family protein [Flavipsychrobacter sp.]|nr:pectinesterase family protein [Flavipsychrobacter sp.]
MKQFSFAKWMACFAVLFFSITRAFGQNAVVAQDGSGNYTTVQAAINAAPTGSTTTWVIYIKNGKYNEVVNIPSTKPFIQLVGQSVANTIIQYNNGASTLVAGSPLGTAGSATLTVNANDCSFINLTIRNTYGDGSQAVAVEINADRVAFKNCRLMGNQDTLYTKGAGNPRHYFRNCYIDGNIDFIFGSSIDIFDSCVVYAKTRTTSGSSFCTAANTTAGQAYGYVFRNCILPANTLGTAYYLGRPWQDALGFSPTTSTPQSNPKVAYINCTLGAHINPVGWVIWDSGTDTTKITDAEYQSKNFDGTLTNVSQRVTWSQQLNSTQAAAYMATSTIFNGWDPCPVIGCGAFTPDIAVSNFAGVKGATVSTFNWNISWPIAGVTYTLYRSTDSIHYSALSNTITSANDTNVNFQLTDPIPPQGGVYYYYIQASKNGLATHITDTVVISSAPTITLTGAPGILTQYLGTPSGGSPYTVSGVNLTAGVIITPPLNFEISSDGGITWHNSTSPITLAPTSGVLAATNILARLNASVNGNYSGFIAHTTIGGLSKYDSVSGTTSNPPAYTETILEEWPFTTGNLDSTGVRALGITATVPTMQHLYLSNGTVVAAIPAYSPTYGEAFGAANSTGDGTWGTSAGGPGGTLNRTMYQQFQITPGNNFSARVDSFILNAAFYNTSNNTTMMVVYSKSNFVSDSANVYGYGFATSGGPGVQDITLPNQTSGPTANFRLGLVGGGSGVTLNHGDTLTIRIYFTCGSSSAGRYATVLNVIAKGFTTQLPAVLEEWPFTTNNQDSAAVRATGVAASVPTLTNLYVSTGTPAAYTPAFGQALSAGTTGGATAGDGHWGTAYGGPGGNLSHIYYEQFTVTPTAGYSVRVDSFILNAGFYGTSSVTSMMVVYSKSNFVSDSTNVYGYGWLIPSGGTAPNIDIALTTSQTSSNSLNWRLGLTNTATGVTITPGTTLTFRVYFTCSSTSAGKYAILENVYAKGITTPLPCPSQPGTITASIANICAGQTNAIYSVPKDTTVNSYTWAFSGSGATFSSTTDSVAVNFANNASSGILSVVANATCGISTASTLPIIVNALPADSITTTNGTTNICGSGTLTLNANTGTGYTYQWSNASGTISGATNATYNANAAGTYTVSITSPAGCSASSQAFAVTVGGVPATITAPVSTIICGNGYLVLNGNTGTGYSYQWQLNGANITNTTATDTVSAAGAYSFVLTDASGCTDTSSTVNITTGSLPADTVTAATSTSFCAGGSVVLNASSTSGATYQWLNNDVAITGATSGSYTASAAGKYSVIVTGSNTCTDTSAKTVVVVHPLPVPVITESSKVLSTGTYTTYQWSFNGANVATSSTLAATVNGNGIYTVTVTDSNGCSNTSAPDTVTDVVGVANVNLAKYITLYPNPATDIVHIDAPLNVNAAVTGMDGRQIFFKNDAKDINISSLAPGVYLIMIYDGNMLIKTDKLLKN